MLSVTLRSPVFCRRRKYLRRTFVLRGAEESVQNCVSAGSRLGSAECVTACFFFLVANVSDYEASLKKEGGIPDGPVLESLLAGETLDKKVETKEEESMSECQVRLLFTA